MHKRARTTPWIREDIVRMVLTDKQTLKAVVALHSAGSSSHRRAN